MPRPLLSALALLVLCACAAPGRTAPPESFDVLLRGGTVLDGTGRPPFTADVGIAGGRIARVGDLARGRAVVELDVRGLMVAPGFVNIHSHARPDALPTAANVLTQGVTTEILNPDGGGPLDVGSQLRELEAAGLAVNVGAYAGFNSVWSAVVGTEDRRPTPAEIEAMRAAVRANLERGAWGVSAGLDYKPAYFARAEEVVRVLAPLREWRTNFANHDRLTPEAGYRSSVGMLETVEIGAAVGMMPVITHMKVQGREQGSAREFLGRMREAEARGVHVAADAYPYLAGQTGLASLLVPGWAQEGGREAMVARFADPAQRARIVAEAEEALAARFGGPEGVYLPATHRELVDVMREMGVASPGEAIVRILESESPSAILRFGAEEDLVEILRHPTTSIACDCGASTALTGHPRGFGTYPRVLGRYVRERRVMSWEEAVRKMTGLPAATVGMVDRGLLAPGMVADVVVLDSARVIDHATYEEPARLSEGIVHVLVNGRLALRDGRVTGERAGRALLRTGNMPSRPTDPPAGRRVGGRGEVVRTGPAPGDGALEVVLDVRQRPGARRASGELRVRDPRTGGVLRAVDFGVLQTMPGWASFTARLRDRGGAEQAAVVIVEVADPLAPTRPPSIVVELEDGTRLTGALRPGASVVSSRGG
jgi:N-acyl-D-amino-acid deacylase